MRAAAALAPSGTNPLADCAADVLRAATRLVDASHALTVELYDGDVLVVYRNIETGSRYACSMSRHRDGEQVAGLLRAWAAAGEPDWSKG